MTKVAAVAAALCATVCAAQEPAYAIAVIAMGSLAAESLFHLCVRSIRGRGAYDGTVYALTDHPRCAPEGVVVVPVQLSAECDKGSSGSMVYKSLKMRVLDVAAANGGEEVVLYLDVDVIVGAPLAPLLEYAAGALRTATLLAYEERVVTRDVRDVTRFATEPYHGGIFAVRRAASEACLAAWSAKVHVEISKAAAAAMRGQRIKRATIRDQPLLGQIVAAGDCAVAHLPPETLTKPSVQVIQLGDYKILNHLSRTSRLKGKRNQHNLTRAHLSKLGADLLDIRGADGKRNWWMKHACPNATPAVLASPLVLECVQPPLGDRGQRARSVTLAPMPALTPEPTPAPTPDAVETARKERKCLKACEKLGKRNQKKCQRECQVVESPNSSRASEAIGDARTAALKSENEALRDEVTALKDEVASLTKKAKLTQRVLLRDDATESRPAASGT